MTATRARQIALSASRRRQRQARQQISAPQPAPKPLPEPDPSKVHLDVLVIQPGDLGPCPALTSRELLAPMNGKARHLAAYDLEPGEHGLPLFDTIELVGRREPVLLEMLGRADPA